MRTQSQIKGTDVQEVYSGAEGRLWELLMGEQIHIGGFQSSMDLATKAKIQPGMTGADLCCCTGAGMTFLVKFMNVAKMTGVDFTPAMVELGRQRAKENKLEDKIEFVQASAYETGLPAECVDFVWSEDCWCYVDNKPALIAEAARIVKKGGTIAWTDWCEGDVPMTEEEATRFLTFMKFPTYATIRDYCDMLEANGCVVEHTENTGRYQPCIDLYMDMVQKQHTFDALRRIDWNMEVLQAIGGEMAFINQLAKEGKIIQSLIVATKK